jgi:hypothetical protein
MLQNYVVVHGTAVIFGLHFRPGIAMQLDELCFIDILRYQRSRMAAGGGLRFGSSERKTASKDTDDD